MAKKKGFLELGLKPGESLRVGDDVSVTVVRIDHAGNAASVELGITAPKHIQVKREEIFNRINGINEGVRRFPVRKKKNQAGKSQRKPADIPAANNRGVPDSEPLSAYVAGSAVAAPKDTKITVKKKRRIAVK